MYSFGSIQSLHGSSGNTAHQARLYNCVLFCACMNCLIAISYRAVSLHYIFIDFPCHDRASSSIPSAEPAIQERS